MTTIEILGIDGGNFETKVAHSTGVDTFSSAMLDDYDTSTITQNYGEDDMLWEYDGITGIAGTIANYEGTFGDNHIFGDSKNHFQAQLRILLAIHQFAKSEDVAIVVGQPFKKHLQEKEDIIKSLKREHPPLTVNGVTKNIKIHEVNVSIEGAAAFYSTNIKEPLARIIDIGSGTVNCITFKNGIMVKDQSDTLPFGTETGLAGKKNDAQSIVKGVYRGMSKVWNNNDPVYVCGGITDNVIESFQEIYPNTKKIEPDLPINKGVKKVSPKFANAVGMLRIARNIYV